MIYDAIDMRIMKYLSRDTDNLTFVNHISKILKLSRTQVRYRLKRLVELNYVCELKVYPVLYSLNKEKLPIIEKLSIPIELLNEYGK